MKLLDDEFLLNSNNAYKLYQDYSSKMPIIDFHCHLNPDEIYYDKKYENITKLWLNDGLYGDHYKWRLMRANGVNEEFITGNGDDYTKFLKWAETIERAYGNPLYEWTHLELKRFFGIECELSRQTAPDIWNKINKLLETDDFTPKQLIQRSNVKVICTTDDPLSELEFHKLLKKEEQDNGFKVLPTLRPDKLLNINKIEFSKYVKDFSNCVSNEINTFNDLIYALKLRFIYFNEIGGKLSDHSLEAFYFEKASNKELDIILNKALNNQSLSDSDINKYKSMLLVELIKLNSEFDWTMQLHVNSVRNINLNKFKQLGPDTGYDMVGTQPDMVKNLVELYSYVSLSFNIPKTIFYSLNENDWLQLVTMMGCFQEDIVQKIQLGSGWWFNDTASGMYKQLETFANQSLLPNFVGMLTDSRSFLSYPRHEYFRRVLCNFYGNLMDQGRIPKDLEKVGNIVKDISYNNAHNYFGFFD